MKNLFIVILPAFFWAISDILTRLSSGKMNAVLGSWLLAFGMMMALAVAAIFAVPNLSKEILAMNPKYVALSIFAGIVNAAGFYYFYKFLQQGGNFTQGMPMILISIVLFVTIYGIIFFKDLITFKTGIGLVLGMASIYFLSS